MNPDMSHGPDEIQRIIWLIDEGGSHPKLTEAIERLKSLRAALAEERAKREGESDQLATAIYHIATRGPFRNIPPDRAEQAERIEAIRAMLQSPTPDATALREALRVLIDDLDYLDRTVDDQGRQYVINARECAEELPALLASPPRDAPGEPEVGRLFDDPKQPPVECKIVSGEHYPDTPTGDIGIEVPAWVFTAGLVRMGDTIHVGFPRRAEVEARIKNGPESPPRDASGEPEVER